MERWDSNPGDLTPGLGPNHIANLPQLALIASTSVLLCQLWKIWFSVIWRLQLLNL